MVFSPVTRLPPEQAVQLALFGCASPEIHVAAM
jgi:hypothetical protein